MLIVAVLSLLRAPAAAQHHGRYGETAIAGAYSPCEKHEDPFVNVEPAKNLNFHVSEPKAQRLMDQGLTLFYAFNYDHAFIKFSEAARKASKVAMAHWGVALAAGANINIGMDDECRDKASAPSWSDSSGRKASS